MKKVIGGRTYNTDTVLLVMEWSAGECSSDRHWEEARLFKTKSGHFFLAGEGGPSTTWATNDGNGNWGTGGGIKPISPREAAEQMLKRKWSEEELKALGFPALADLEGWRRVMQWRD